jgi:hypothetical protein
MAGWGWAWVRGQNYCGRAFESTLAGTAQRLLALTAAIWHDDHTGQPVARSLLAYDH